MQRLTDFQHRQLLALHFTGELIYRSDNGHRWPARAWRGMIDTLVGLGYIDSRQLRLTEVGRQYLESVELGKLGKGVE